MSLHATSRKRDVPWKNMIKLSNNTSQVRIFRGFPRMYDGNKKLIEEHKKKLSSILLK